MKITCERCGKSATVTLESALCAFCKELRRDYYEDTGRLPLSFLPQDSDLVEALRPSDGSRIDPDLVDDLAQRYVNGLLSITNAERKKLKVKLDDALAVQVIMEALRGDISESLSDSLTEVVEEFREESPGLFE